MDETLKLELHSDASRGKHWHGKCVACGKPILLPYAVFNDARWDPPCFACWYCPQRYDSPQESDDNKECRFRVVPPTSVSQSPAGAATVVPDSPAPAPTQRDSLGTDKARESSDEPSQATSEGGAAAAADQAVASPIGDGKTLEREESVLPATIDAIHAALRTVSDAALNSVAVAEDRARRLDELLTVSLASVQQALESLVQVTKSSGDEARQSLNVAKTGAAELGARIVKTLNEWSVEASASKNHFDQVIEQNLNMVRGKIDNFFEALARQIRRTQEMVEGIEKSAGQQQKKTSEREKSTSDYLADLKATATANNTANTKWLQLIYKHVKRLAEAKSASGESAAAAGGAESETGQVAATIGPSTLDSQTVSTSPTSSVGLAPAVIPAVRGPALGLLQDQALLAQTVRDAIHETLLAPNAIVDVLRRVHEFRLPELNPGRERIPEDLPQLFDIIENEWISWSDPRRPVASDELRRDVVRLLRDIRMAIESWHQSHGIARFGEVGERYDYAVHELASTVTTSERTMADRIKEVVSSGYRLMDGERLLKKAKVVVWVMPRDATANG